MKKLASLLLAFCMLASLTACKKQSDLSSNYSSIGSSDVIVTSQNETSNVSEDSSEISTDDSAITSVENESTATTPSSTPSVETTVPVESQNSTTTTSVVQSQETNDTEKENQFNAANQAYHDLSSAAQACESIMDSIYNAWYFAIYEGDNYSDATSCVNAFCSYTGLDYNATVDAINAQITYLGYEIDGITQLAILRTFRNTIDVVVRVYTTNGMYAAVEECLNSARDNIATLTNEYADYTGYSTLKLYYSEAWAYYNFALSPTGSFSSLETTMNTYETNLRTYNNDLAFTFIF